MPYYCLLSFCLLSSTYSYDWSDRTHIKPTHVHRKCVIHIYMNALTFRCVPFKVYILNLMALFTEICLINIQYIYAARTASEAWLTAPSGGRRLSLGALCGVPFPAMHTCVWTGCDPARYSWCPGWCRCCASPGWCEMRWTEGWSLWGIRSQDRRGLAVGTAALRTHCPPGQHPVCVRVCVRKWRYANCSEFEQRKASSTWVPLSSDEALSWLFLINRTKKL